jgi:hypothetical protein
MRNVEKYIGVRMSIPLIYMFVIVLIQLQEEPTFVLVFFPWHFGHVYQWEDEDGTECP